MDWFVHFDQGIQEYANSLGWPLEAFLRLLLAAVYGGLVGLEREFRGRQAGFRTMLLVALGSALVMLVSMHFTRMEWKSPDAQRVQINIDPARIAYGVMTGIGFLGAGTIIQSGGTVRGLTTAAAIWCTAGIGLGCGVGMYTVGLFATLMVVVALWILDYFEDFLPKLRYRTVTVRRSWSSGCISEAVQKFKKAGFHVVDASFQRTGATMREVDIDIRIAFIDADSYYSFERQLTGEDGYELLSTREL